MWAWCAQGKYCFGCTLYTYIYTYTLGAEDHKFRVHNQLLQDAKELYGFAGNVIVDEEFAAYAEEVVNTNQIVYLPSNYYEALTLYFTQIQDAQEIVVYLYVVR